jgi:UDP-N-acetyl-2-amino-2-deoxyglucuronate dehydrogenase
MKIRFGLLGAGYIANRHAEHITQHPDAELVGFFDTDLAKAKLLAEKHKATAFATLHDLLQSNCDIVNVCTPNGLHAEGAIAALQAGKHALVEKPMALSVSECEQMITTSLKHDRKLFVVKQNRFNPPVKALKELIDSGRLGKVLSVQINCFWNRNEKYYNNSDWKGTKALDGGTLFTQFSHFVDVFYYLFGDVEDIKGVAGNLNHGSLIEFEDSGFFTFKFKSGALGSFNYTTCSYEQNMEGSITVFAENATIKAGGKYLNTIDYQRTDGFDIGDLPQSGVANDYGYYQGSMSNHDKMINNVVQALNGKEQIMTNAFEGLKVVDIIERMYNSVK